MTTLSKVNPFFKVMMTTVLTRLKADDWEQVISLLRVIVLRYEQAGPEGMAEFVQELLHGAQHSQQ